MQLGPGPFRVLAAEAVLALLDLGHHVADPLQLSAQMILAQVEQFDDVSRCARGGLVVQALGGEQ